MSSKFYFFCADILVGMPSTSTGSLEMKLATEHSRFLVAELNVRVSRLWYFVNVLPIEVYCMSHIYACPLLSLCLIFCLVL